MKVDGAADRAPARDHASGPAIDRISPEGRAIFVEMLAEIALARVLADLAAEDAAATEHPAEVVSPETTSPTRRRAR